MIEQYGYIAEKKQVSSKSTLMNVDYFKKMKEQKQNLNTIVILFIIVIRISLQFFHRKLIKQKTFCFINLVC